jgi:hypothetical protein
MRVIRVAIPHEVRARIDTATGRNSAATNISPVQMIVHDDLPLVGTQFHPDDATDEYPAGHILIRSFMKWSNLIWATPLSPERRRSRNASTLRIDAEG